MTGRVTRIVKQRDQGRDQGGYFFIRDAEGHDRFAHARDLIGVTLSELQVDETVVFRPLDGGPRGNGLRAEQVSRPDTQEIHDPAAA